MKGIDIFCASQAATAICLSMEKEEGSSSSFLPLGSNGRTIDRYNPIIRDPRRLGIGKTIPPASSSSSSSAPSSSSSSSSSSSNANSKKTNTINELKKTKKKKISATAKAEKSSSDGRSADFDFDDDHDKGILTTRTNYKSWRCSTKAGDFISPPGGSSRYLLSDQTKFLNVISDFDPVLELVPVDEKTSNSTTTTAQVLLKNDHPRDDNDNDNDNEISPSPSKSRPPPSSSSSSSSSSSLPQDQVVVVLRVSLHCRGCERKMRKHISRMEGVSSFSIDFAAKKVTVVGNVTPLGVLNSISKVKTAQLWNPSNSTPLPNPPPSSSIKNNSDGMMMMTTMKPPPQPIFMQGLT